MMIEMYADGGSDMVQPRNKLREILENLGDAVPTHLQHLRRQDLEAEQMQSPEGEKVSAVGEWQKGASEWHDGTDDSQEDTEAGPSQVNEHSAHRPGTAEFEAEWARLPSAITALPSFIRIKDLAIRNFHRSLLVVPNGVDHCFMSRPAFRQVLNDLDTEYQDALFDPIEQAGLMPPHPDPLTMTEALWESQFGVPRTLAWYSALAEGPSGINSCVLVRFNPPKPARFGLHPGMVDAANDRVHCAVAGTKQPITLVGPTTGLLYIVVQGSLLLITWPCSDRNYFAWQRRSRNANINQFERLEDFENPTVNVLRTGNAVYLQPAKMFALVSLTNVCLTSRQILNPASKELHNIIRFSDRLIDTYIKQLRAGYSPFDDLEVEKMEANIETWILLLKKGDKGLMAKKNRSTRLPAEGMRLNRQKKTKFVRGLEAIREDIKTYRKLVEKAAKRDHQSSGCPHNRPFETLEAVAELAAITGAGSAVSSPSGSVGVDALSPQMRSGLGLKGKDRAPN